MKIERTENAVRNILWGVIEKISVLLLPFITRTVMIKVLGAEYVGLNSLFTSILQVLSISELGIGTAIVFSMYKPIAEDEKDMLCALLNAYKKIYFIIGNIIMICGVAVIPFLKFLVKGDLPANVNMYVLYIIYLANTVISYYLFAYKAALFSAHQRNDLISKRTAVVSTVSNCFQIVLLLTFKNYYAYAIIIPLATIITNLANAYLAQKMFPDIQCYGTLPSDVKDGIKKRIIGLVSFKIYNAVFTSVDTIVISAFLGLTPLAIFNNYYYIQTALVGFLIIITASITAGVGNKMVINTPEENYQDFINFTFANGWICSWCAVCMLCLYQHFMEWWVGKELVFSFNTMILMVLYFLLPRITTMTYTYREAAGLWWEDRFRPIVATIVNLFVNIVLVKLIGINGVIISTLICTVFINVPWGTSVLFKNYFKNSPMEYFLKIIVYIIITLITGGISLLVCNLMPSTGFIAMVGKGLICMVIPNLLFWVAYHRMSEYEYMKSMAKNLINKVRRN
ncbi:lipopolysaccharide biosynthesis protein [Robinsoniella sp. KNHs210]|uniref:lipopolysaccharide biosynthesis protein n=1 Tax=Robinsoniella sp. KNHs210 TaxID=1469950 RepID=UPI000487A97F|nr:oligosaccharide flippase family protein [Robinsoniella sp. KNHs210]